MNNANTPLASTCRLRLVMEVTYTLNGHTIAEMSTHLCNMAERAVLDGHLTGETEAEVAQHTGQVRVVPELLTEDEVAAFMLKRIGNGDIDLDDMPVRLARYGLMNPIEFSEEMRQRMENSKIDAEGQTDPIAPELLTPSVQARVTSDVTRAEVEFDAAPWFAQASDEDIRELQSIDWAGNYAADAVAEHFTETNADIRNILNEGGGFECYVNRDNAIAWLYQHKRDLWASLLCETNDVCVVPIDGVWRWSQDASSKPSTEPFQTESEACLAAVASLKLGPAGPVTRQDEIQAELAKRGLRMEHSLAALAGEGHAIMQISTEEMVETPDAAVIALAEEWSVREGMQVNDPSLLSAPAALAWAQMKSKQ